MSPFEVLKGLKLPESKNIPTKFNEMISCSESAVVPVGCRAEELYKINKKFEFF